MTHKIHSDAKCIKYVKCIDTGGWQDLTVGKVYEVTKVIPCDDKEFKYQILDDSLSFSVFYSKRFTDCTIKTKHNLSKLKEM